MDGNPLISYKDGTNTDLNLKVAHCHDRTCASVDTAVLDSAGNVGDATSITIGNDNFGLISYFDVTNLRLKVAHCKDVHCSVADTYVVDSASNAGHDTSIVIGLDGLGLISHHVHTSSLDLKVSHCRDTACSVTDNYTIESAGDTGHLTSMTIGVDGFGLISYLYGGTSDLRVAHLSNRFGIPYHRMR